MSELIFRACLAGLLTSSFILLGFSTLAANKTPDEARTDCVDAPQISDATTVQGHGEIRLNNEGTLLLALDSTGNSQTDVLFRIATYPNQRALEAALESSTDSQSLLVVQRDGVKYHDLEISGFKGDPEAILFVMDRRECAPNRMPSEIIASTARMPAMAISRETSPAWDQSPSQLVSDRMDEPLIIRQSELAADSDAQQQFEPLWCMAGGEGAVACSLSFGGIGPITGGECSIECGNFPATYACCGPAFAGSNCQCISADPTTPGGPGDGDSGDGGGSGGDGGSGGPGGGGGDSGDDDGDDDDNEGDEESNCVDCGPTSP